MERWIPIVDYAVMKGISTSTLRRYIKAKKIIYKIEKGKYLILAEEQAQQPVKMMQHTNNIPSSINVFERVRELEFQLTQAQEQINELQMLVAIYEEKLSQIGH